VFKEIFTFHEESATLSAAFSPDGLRIASGSADHTIKLWAPPGKASRTLGPRRGDNNVEFSPDGRRVASVAGGTIVISDAISGKETLWLKGGNRYGRVTWSPDGKRVALGSKIWDAATGAADGQLERPKLATDFSSGDTAFSRDGKFLATAINPTSIGVWDVNTGHCLHVLGTANYASCAAFSADGRQLAVGISLEYARDPEALQIWDLATGKVALTPEGFLPGVNGLAFSPDGKLLAAAVGNYGGGDGEVRVWDAVTGQPVFNLRGHSECVWRVSFSPDGKRLASASGKYDGRTETPGEVKIWDMRTGQEVCTLRVDRHVVYGVAFSPDGRRLATSSGDGTVRIWDGTPLAETPARDAILLSPAKPMALFS
jgi:WD40 repeat protein